MKQHQLDALLFPGGSGAAIAARPRYPTVIVPFAMVPNKPGAGLEQATRRRVPPASTP